MRFTLTLIILIFLFSFKMEKAAYRIFDKDGKESNYQQMLDKVKNADIVFFGELHNNPICHWLQLELTKDLYFLKKKDLMLAAEMFEADNQLLVNEYLSQQITAKQLKDEGKMWDNFDTDYKPLLDFAQKQGLSFVASNIPRRYASMVSRKGLESLNNLSDEAKKWIAPLPLTVDLTLPAYANMIQMMKGSGGHQSGMGEMQPENFAKAQAIKDATMAYFILKNWNKGKLLLHFNGAYHSDNFESILWYLKKAQPQLNIATLSSVEQKEINALSSEHKGKADFILAIPDSMTKTY